MLMGATTQGGKAFIKHGWEACAAVERHAIDGKIFVRIFGFPDDQPSRVDAVMIDKATKEIFGTLEIKSRNMTEEAFCVRYDMEAMVSFDKLQSSYANVIKLMVPHWMLIYCVPSGVAFLKKVFDAGNKSDFRPIVVSNFKTRGEMALINHTSSTLRKESRSYVDMKGAERIVVKTVELQL